jgi:LysM repeat protein
MHPNKIKYVISQNQETYETIAKSLNIKLKQILKYNDDKKLSVLKVGTKVFIQPKRNRSKQRTHVVNKGEDLRLISQTYGIKMKSLKKRNELILKNGLNNGDKLRLR